VKNLKIKNRHRIKKKEIKNILTELKNNFDSDFFSEDARVEVGDFENFRIIIVEGEVLFIIYKERIILTLKGLLKYKIEDYYVIVDMGAVGFVTKGADIMVPGIVDADTKIRENDFVWVCDERHRKPLAIGIALMSGEEMKHKNKGKGVKNIHYVGDKLWKLSLSAI
jgi:PUA domain protein